MISQHIPGKVNLDLADHDLKNDLLRSALNSQFQNRGMGTSRREGLYGTKEVELNLPSGDNRCVGSATDESAERCIFFIYNSLGRHGIYLYNALNTSVTKLIQWDGFGFQKNTNITGIGIIGDIVVWCNENFNTRAISIKLALDGYYNEISEDKITYLKPPLKERVRIGHKYDLAGARNEIAFDNYKFTVRLLYKDGGASVISPWSSPTLGELKPTYTSEKRNRVGLALTMPKITFRSLKGIEWIFQRNDEENFYIFKYMNEKELASSENSIQSNPTAVIQFEFDNKSTNYIPVSTLVATTMEEAIPTRSNALASLYNRIFLNKYESGLDVLTENFTLTVEKQVILENYANESQQLYRNLANFKSWGQYKAGVVFFDSQMRRTGVRGITSFNAGALGTQSADTSGFSMSNNQQIRARWKIEGKAPIGSKYYQIYCTREQSQVTYFQCPAGVGFYLTDGDPGVITTYSLRERYYITSRPISRSQYTFIHLFLPQNIPFTPDTKCFVRIKKGFGVSGNTAFKDVIELPVLEVFEDNILVINDPGIGDFSSVDCNVFVEVYLPNSERNDNFFAATDIYPVNDNQDFVPPIQGQNVANNLFEGDMCRAVLKESTTFYWDDDVEAALTYDDASGNKINYETNVRSSGADVTYYVESPVHIVDQSWADTTSEIRYTTYAHLPQNSGARILLSGSIEGALKNQVRVEQTLGVLPNPNVGLDYNKIPNPFGHPNIEIPAEKQINAPNELFFSEESTSGGLINNLFNVPWENSYYLPEDRGKITAFVPVVRILLAIHEKSTTSMYIQEGFLKQGFDDMLTRTDGVIGDNRELMSQYGCQNPESIVAKDGRAYWWDFNRADWVRYAANGLVPLGKTYGFGSLFQALKETYQQVGIFPRVYGGYDSQQDIAWLTFEEVDTDTSSGLSNEANRITKDTVVKIPSLTIGFSERAEGFIGFASFAPERYGMAGNELLSFKNGKLYRHVDNLKRNYFYGQQFPIQLKFLINPIPDIPKLFQNIHLDANKDGGWTVPKAITEGQETSLDQQHFTEREDELYADILKDKNTPSDLMDPGEIALLSGKDMEGPYMEITIESYHSQPKVDGLNVGYLSKSGHQIEFLKDPDNN